MLNIESPLEMALAYANRSWHIFPLHTWRDGACDCRKKCDSPAKHPRTLNGFKDATTDERKIRYFWGMWPHANIGIATGKVSGIVVVDIDPYNGGLETSDKLTFPETARVKTGRGTHLYYLYFGKTKQGMGAGIDVKGDGGYVVAPPSVGAYGPYVWQRATEPVTL